MIETIFGWLGYTSTSKYMIVLSQLESLRNEIFWYKFVNLGCQLVLIAIAAWMIWRFWCVIKPSMKAEKPKEEKKEGKTSP